MTYARRIGYFRVSRGELVGPEVSSAVKALMRDLVVVQTRELFCQDSIEYLAYCDVFEPVEPAMIASFYVAEVAETDDGFTVKWQKQEGRDRDLGEICKFHVKPKRDMPWR